MRSLAAVILGLWLATAGSAAVAATQKKAAPKKSTSTNKSASKPAPKKAAARKPAASSRTTTTTAAAKKKTRRSRAKPTWRTSQQAPAPERYREIQQALVDKGYLAGPATGAWGPESIEALKRFEQDQNLTPDGKLDSLVLIALGLGPRRETAAAPATPNPATRAVPDTHRDQLDIPTRREPNEDRRSP